MEIKIRKAIEADTKGMAKVHVDSWKTAYKRIVSDEFLANLSYESREKQWKSIFKQATPNHYTYVAEISDGTVIGFINGGPERTEKYNCDGELYAIYILQEYRGLKVGQQLFQSLVLNFIQSEFRSVLVWVISNNPSKSFYEKYSPDCIDTKFINRLGVEEMAYGWSDIHSLNNRLIQ
ncbi:GNAT family N-acetyltransferase [Bacillus sp. DX4.1]|uniref:GNAT family N-acetyltransferase n=1 Tax=Bacillus sp. DX4.1 TaxID=3055867 RepID=UPI0025A08393|nr:GNAT family N-acetyltransferase [Bacillus sp. DX4.1]MDM5188233.1 GNAT family N-acetyltransferase [Bacillus sp. DX4.1]